MPGAAARWLIAMAVVGRRPLSLALAGVSASAWLLVLTSSASHKTVLAICGGWNVPAGATVDLDFAVALHRPLAVAGDWTVMVLAMTAPLLHQPIRRVWTASLARRRPAAVVLFVAGYGAAWTTAGVAFEGAAIVLSSVLGTWALAAGLAFAAILRFAATRRLAQTRSHEAPQLRVFGLSAWSDSLTYGLTHGAWCAFACWPSMLAPLVAGPAHLAVMVVAAGVMLIERHAPNSGRDAPLSRPVPAPVRTRVCRQTA